MTMYEKIYEALNDQVAEGVLTVEEAEELNDMAYEKYVESANEDDDNITLEDAMDYINDYLNGDVDMTVSESAEDLIANIDALKLKVYESASVGIITDEERDEFLEYLNLENYE